MDRARKINLSAAIFVLICFFLPWVQLNCLGVRESVSGFDLARGGERSLWFVPMLMLVIIVFGITRSISKQVSAIFALVSVAGGTLSAYLMHRQYSEAEGAALIAPQWTVWFWLGFVASICIAIGAIAFYARRSRSP